MNWNLSIYAAIAGPADFSQTSVVFWPIQTRRCSWATHSVLAQSENLRPHNRSKPNDFGNNQTNCSWVRSMMTDSSTESNSIESLYRHRARLPLQIQHFNGNTNFNPSIDYNRGWTLKKRFQSASSTSTTTRELTKVKIVPPTCLLSLVENRSFVQWHHHHDFSMVSITTVICGWF